MRLAIKASGMVTAVGFNSPASCAAMRAGIRNINETNLWDAESGTYLSAGRVLLPHWWIGVGKLAELLAPAIRECFAAATPIRAQDIPVLLGVSSPERPCRVERLDEQIITEVQYRLNVRLHPASCIIPRDHVAVAVALIKANELINSGSVPCCVVAAVDSLIQQDVVEYYLERRRLLTPLNSNGFSVGEAASAILVASAEIGIEQGLQLLGIGVAMETATIESEEPLRGEGLTEAIRRAFADAGCSVQDVQYRISDLNGEHYKFKEMSLAMGRFPRKPTQRLFDLWHPIEYIGDIGAAIGPLVLAVALHAGQKDYGPGRNVLCTYSNDDGKRAAIVTRYNC